MIQRKTGFSGNDPAPPGERPRAGRSGYGAVRGVWYDGKSSAAVPAVVSRDADGVVRVAGAGSGRELAAAGPEAVDAPSRLGSTAASLTFPGGGRFETDDNDGLDALLPGKRNNRVHFLESRKSWILAAMLLLVLGAWWAVRHGVPAAADGISRLLPETAYRYASEKTLAVLDRAVLRPSRLPDARRLHVHASLQPAVEAHPDMDVRVLFRSGPAVGANAFALPSGTVIFTDDMVRLSRHPAELQAILHHEAGHVALRHGMRRVVQDSLLAFAVAAVVGDVSGVSELFLALPVLLTEQAYSREFERQADAFALERLRAEGICPDRFSAMLRRMDRVRSGGGKKEEAGGRAEVIAGYLSTHPGTEDRLESFDRASREMGCDTGEE